MSAGGAVPALLRTVQEVQGRFHGAHQLSSAVPPDGPLLRVSAQPRLQLVQPKGQRSLSVRRQRGWTSGTGLGRDPRVSCVCAPPP